MKSAPALPEEARRVRRLHALGALDAGAQAVLDTFTEHAAALTAMPFALICLIDGERQWFTAARGLPAGALASSGRSFCNQAVAGQGVWEVEDASQDPRFAAEPLVAGEPRVAHCAAAPLRLPGGEAIGAICVMASAPGRLDARALATLTHLASSVVSVLALRERERAAHDEEQVEQLESLAEFAPVGMCAVDEHGALVHVNRRWLEILGLDGAQAALGEGWFEAIEAGQQGALRTAWADAVRRRVEFQAVVRTQAKGQGARDVRVRLEPTLSGASVWPFVGAIVDVTEKTRLAAALMERNSLLESVIENTPCGLAVFDQDGRHVASNHQLRRLLDLPDALFDDPELKLDTLVHFNASRGEYGPGDATELAAQRLALGRSDQASRHERVRPDGSMLEIRVSFMPNGWQVQTYVDVTEERAAAAGLRASQEQLGLALKATGLGLWEYKPLDDVAYLSESWGQILGYPPQERYMRSAELIGMSLPEHAMVFRDALVGLLKGETPQLSIEHEARHASGGTIWLLTEAQVTRRDAAGRALRVVGTTKDVTQRKREQRALEDAVAAAENANRAKAQFLATMSHEIRTPINGVIGLARMLEEQPLPPREAGYVRMINSCADTLLGLVNDVLDFSKIEAGQMVLERVDVNLHALLRDMSDVFETRARAKDVGFALRIAPTVPEWIKVDPNRLRQILLNLLSNALKFTAQGRFSLDVTQGSHNGVHTLRCEVSDTGIGIAPADQAKLFKRFSQVDASNTRKYQGTGLGLAISRDLALLMGGDIHVSSLPGMGSSFVLEIPLVAAPALTEQPKPQAPAPASTARLLLVEDNPVNRLVAKALLTRLGYADITTANDGQEALDLCRDQSFDLVLMDCQMPVMDGFEATRRLRAGGFDRPIIALTAGAVSNDRDRCLAMGMNDYLAKPIDSALLGAAIEVWLKLGQAASASLLR